MSNELILISIYMLFNSITVFARRLVGFRKIVLSIYLGPFLFDFRVTLDDFAFVIPEDSPGTSTSVFATFGETGGGAAPGASSF